MSTHEHIASISGQAMKFEDVDQNRRGDPIWYISNLDKMKAHFPGWGMTKDLRTTFEEICASWRQRFRAREY